MSSTLSLPQPETFVLPSRARFLMCRPDLYDVTYVINPWMAGNVHHSSRSRAVEQWTGLYNAVSHLADVELIAPVAGSPDMVFTANAGLERDGVAVLSAFAHPERQGEEDHFAAWLREAGYVVLRTQRGTPFEGEGDALFSTEGDVLWVGYGPRTARASHAALARVWDVEVRSLGLVDPRFYHLDTCFAPLAGGYLLYFPEAFDRESQRRIEEHYPAAKRIAVREEDAVHFACNAVNVDQTVIVNEISPSLASDLRERGFQVLQTPLSEFLKAGGAAKCLVMRLSGESGSTRTL